MTTSLRTPPYHGITSIHHRIEAKRKGLVEDVATASSLSWNAFVAH